METKFALYSGRLIFKNAYYLHKISRKIGAKIPKKAWFYGTVTENFHPCDLEGVDFAFFKGIVSIKADVQLEDVHMSYRAHTFFRFAMLLKMLLTGSKESPLQHCIKSLKPANRLPGQEGPAGAWNRRGERAEESIGKQDQKLSSYKILFNLHFLLILLF